MFWDRAGVHVDASSCEGCHDVSGFTTHSRTKVISLLNARGHQINEFNVTTNHGHVYSVGARRRRRWLPYSTYATTAATAVAVAIAVELALFHLYSTPVPETMAVLASQFALPS